MYRKNIIAKNRSYHMLFFVIEPSKKSRSNFRSKIF